MRLRNCSLPLAGSQAAEAAREFGQAGLEAAKAIFLQNVGQCTSQPVLGVCTCVTSTKWQRSRRRVLASGVNVEDGD